MKNSNEEEYKKLKEEYKTSNFNFEGIQIKAVPLSKFVYPNKKVKFSEKILGKIIFEQIHIKKNFTP